MRCSSFHEVIFFESSNNPMAIRLNEDAITSS